MKKIRNILFVALGLFMITFALVGCSNNNNEASVDVNRRASLASTSNQVSTANLSTTTSSTTGITLKKAVENNIKFNKIWFSTQFYGNDNGDGWFDLSEEYEYICSSGSLYSQELQSYSEEFIYPFQHYDRCIIPVYSSELGKFVYCVQLVYAAPCLSEVEIGFLLDKNLTTITEVVEWVKEDRIYEGAYLDVHAVTDYENSEDFSIKEISPSSTTPLVLEKAISPALDMTNVLYYNYEVHNVVETVNLTTWDEYISSAIMAGIMVEPGDTDNPAISTPTINVDVDNPIPFSEIKAQITATDPTEGDITSKIEIVSNEYVLDANEKIPVGNYEYVVKVTDEALNSSTATGLICVQDTKAPVVTANNATTLYNVTLTDEEIRSLFNYSDNYDSTDALNVVINRDAYTNNLGTYDITCQVTDLSGNTGEATAKVTVYDSIRPTLYTPKNLTLSTVSPINYDDVFAKCGAYDGYDGEIEFTLTDTDKMVETKAVGSYTWTIEASDSTGNKSIETFEIIIVDKDIPVINFNTDYFFFTSKYNLLTKDEIVTMLLKTSQVTGSVESNNIESITSDYFNSPHEVGEYDLKVKLSDGTTYDNTVVVTEEPEKEFKFTDLFTKAYWETWANNWKTPDNWNWLHWTIISIGAVAVLAAVVAVLKKK